MFVSVARDTHQNSYIGSLPNQVKIFLKIIVIFLGLVFYLIHFS